MTIDLEIRATKQCDNKIGLMTGSLHSGESTHPIEVESYKILRERFDLSDVDLTSIGVVERIIHATADEQLARSVTISPEFFSKCEEAFKDNLPVICDVKMVQAGLGYDNVLCGLDEARSRPERPEHYTLTEYGLELAASRFPRGFIAVIGCAPSALDRLLDLCEEGPITPIAVIAMPVGFVGALSSKERLANSTLPYITNSTERGGSAATCAAFNAVVRQYYANNRVRPDQSVSLVRDALS